MPWPTVPPDVDMPVPALRDPTIAAFAFRLKSVGMDPHVDQTDCDFFVDGHEVALWLPHVLDASKHAYDGVGLADLASVGNTLTLSSTYQGQHKRSEKLSPVKPVSFDTRITSVKHSAAGGEVTLRVGVELAAGSSGAFVVAAPYARKMPKFANHGAYVAAGAWVAVDRSGTLELKVVPGGVTQYGLFVAKNVPSQITPLSAVSLHSL